MVENYSFPGRNPWIDPALSVATDLLDCSLNSDQLAGGTKNHTLRTLLGVEAAEAAISAFDLLADASQRNPYLGAGLLYLMRDGTLPDVR